MKSGPFFPISFSLGAVSLLGLIHLKFNLKSMKRVAFFEIPALNFERAVVFYERVLNIELLRMECSSEQMAFFPEEEGVYPGAISRAEGFLPSSAGVLISLFVEDMDKALSRVVQNGGSVVRSKTKIDAEDRGFFALFMDSEGNQVGFYSS